MAAAGIGLAPGPSKQSRKKRRSVHRRHLKFTREGRVFVLVTLGLGFAALNTGNNLMVLSMGFMLSLIVLSGILSELVLRELKVTRSLPSRSFEGEPMLIELTVRNAKERLPSFSIEVEDQAVDVPNDRRCYLLRVEPAGPDGVPGERAVTYRRVPPRRGRLQFDSFRVSTRYPFSLFEKWRHLDVEDACVVFPRREAWPVEASLSSTRAGDQAGSAIGRGTETRELRDYRTNDDVRRIHWRRTAALGRPIVREMEDQAAQRISLAVDNACEADDPDAVLRLESAIARAAHAVPVLLGRGAAVEIVCRGDRSVLVDGGGTPDRLWHFLALLQPVAQQDAPAMETSRPGAERMTIEGVLAP